ncbi:DUF2237 family protein [Motilimonas cestriensis]|uniref:DUF2237 family protein n=1 Tax=Motilimonas cestriensis TaxID=2742685 RepID=UPI003DA5E2BE
MDNQLNVLGTHLALCDCNTGYTRKGFCEVPNSDFGNHSVCAVMTNEFLQFTLAQGNDLISPNPMYNFPGLNKWCLCASRWLQAAQANVAPPVILEATQQKALERISLALLQVHQYQG